jgi:phospholipid/cholesterol/gamma-HCH transport system substrate-binding protein
MKINNETKIGILAVVGIVLLIVGFNFLKGKNLFKKDNRLYAVYSDVQGLAKSNPVVINGLQIGRIESLEGGKDMKRILVTVSLYKDVNIPINSLALINPNLLGSPTMEIQLGSSPKYLHSGDTLLTTLSGSAFNEALKIINPVLYEVRNAVKSLDSVFNLVTNVFDTRTKNNIKEIVANLNTVTQSFSVSAVSLQTMLDAQNGALSKSLQNVNVFTTNLNSNNERMNNIMENTRKATAHLASINLQKTLDSLNLVVNNLIEGSSKINSKEGSLGLLLNDKTLYNNLEATTNKLNILIDDIRVHPKRYVNISLFGKKDKGDYLTAPLIDDTLKVVYP